MNKKFSNSISYLLLFLIVWLVLGAIFSGILPFGRGPEGEWSTKTHEQYGFTIEYPTKWRIATYGQDGYRGLDETKLRIWDNNLTNFQIEVFLRSASSPTLEDVLSWHNVWLQQDRESVVSRGGDDYEEINLGEDTIQNQLVIRQTYKLGNSLYETVYIARSNDMIMIEMQSSEQEHDMYIDDFNRIIKSFKPIP